MSATPSTLSGPYLGSVSIYFVCMCIWAVEGGGGGHMPLVPDPPMISEITEENNYGIRSHYNVAHKAALSLHFMVLKCSWSHVEHHYSIVTLVCKVYQFQTFRSVY